MLESEHEPELNSPQFVTAVTTIDRKEYLEQFIHGWNKSRDKSANQMLIVADDGSTDGTLEWLCDELEIEDYKLVVMETTPWESLGRQIVLLIILVIYTSAPMQFSCAMMILDFSKRGGTIHILGPCQNLGMTTLFISILTGRNLLTAKNRPGSQSYNPPVPLGMPWDASTPLLQVLSRDWDSLMRTHFQLGDIHMLTTRLGHAD